MATRATYRSVTSNIYTSDPASQQEGTIREAWSHADVLKINEGWDASTSTGLRSLKGATYYRPGNSVGRANPIAWRDSVFKLLSSGSKTCFEASHGSPDRGVVWVLLEHRKTGQKVLEFNHHQIHQAFTTHTERRPYWDQIQDGITDEIKRVMGFHPGVPAVVSGDTNRPNSDGEPTWPGTGAVQVDTPATYGAQRYDKFWRIGSLSVRDVNAFTTNSDHKSLQVIFEITTAVAAAPVKKPAPVVAGTKSDPAKPAVPTPVQQSTPEDLRRRATYRSRPRWRYFAQRMLGDGTAGEILHHDLPLADVEIEDNLTGHNALTGTISPEIASLVAPDGRPLLDEWGTAIWAEESDNIHGGGILTHSGFDGPKWGLDCVGLTGYAADLPYASSQYFVETDPADIIRHIWAHIQAQPGGNIGLEVDGLKTGLSIGVALEQGEFDTQSGPLTFESGPYKLAWYQDHDLASNLDTLASDNSIDWHEEHYYSGEVLHHRLRLGFPQLGRRRDDLRFVLGENIIAKPSVDRDGADYADEVWALGAGEGALMVRGVARRDINRLRRVAVVTDPSLRSQAGVNSAASRELAWRHTLETISEVVVRDHPHADVGSLAVGDEINVEAATGWVDVDAWYRVVSRKIKPQAPDRMTLTLMRTDKIAT
jgi:hypothetical protein